MINVVQSALRRIFRDRVTGRIVVAQFPNPPLLVWILASILRWVLHPEGHVSSLLWVVGNTALLVWAGDEILRGANAWRRFLGAAVLLGLIGLWGVAV